MFPMGLVGFFAGFQIAVFAFVGIELVGTTAAETANPERNLPKAINSIPVRIIIFYVLALIAIMLAGEGLHATQRGRRIHFGSGAPKVEAGPFSPASEQIAGFWLWDVRSLDEAVEWASRAPFNSGGTLELRPLISAEDFGEAFTPELQQQEQRLRAQLEG